MGNHGLVRVLEKKQDFIAFYRNPLHYGMALGLWPWPCSVGFGLGLECSGLVNITDLMFRFVHSPTQHDVKLSCFDLYLDLHLTV